MCKPERNGIMSPQLANTTKLPDDIKLYKRRWLIMCLFMWYTITCGVQWVEFSGISNIVSKYYQVPPSHVEWTTIVYMVGYVVAVFPCMYVMEHMKVRNTMIIASAGTCVGACIKILAVAPDRFYVVIIGQCFEGVFTVFTYGAAARFTAVWFGRKEITLAGALALFGDQAGGALSFLLPTKLVHDNTDLQVLEREMFQLHITVAAGCVLTLFLVVLFFKEEPRCPPSIAQARQKELQTENVGKSVIKILSRPSFLLIALSYSLSLAASNALATLLNPLILDYFPNHTEDAGNVGTLYMLSGFFSTLIISYILDKTGKFKENAIILTAGGAISLALLTASLEWKNMSYVYISATLVGFFLQGYYGTGIQTCIEVTYPISENTSIATLFLFVQFFSIGMTSLYGFAIRTFGDYISNIGMVIVLSVSSILACLIPPNLKRQNVENEVVSVEMKEFLPKI